jgi:hypothetical protein
MAVRASFLAGERAACAADGTPSRWLDRAEADFAGFVAASREDLVLGQARGLTQVLVTCDDGNVGSRRVIEANGGVLEPGAADGTCRYWISL